MVPYGGTLSGDLGTLRFPQSRSVKLMTG